jgi:hypothetical protein
MSFRRTTKFLDLEVDLDNVGGYQQLSVRFPSGAVIKEMFQDSHEMLWYLSVLLEGRAQQLEAGRVQ